MDPVYHIIKVLEAQTAEHILRSRTSMFSSGKDLKSLNLEAMTKYDLRTLLGYLKWTKAQIGQAMDRTCRASH